MSLNAVDERGELLHQHTTTVMNPGYLVNLGHLQTVIGGLRVPLLPAAGEGFVQIRPPTAKPVLVTSEPCGVSRAA